MDPEPNLIAHTPPPPQVQTTLTNFKGRPSPFTWPQKNYIAKAVKDFMGGLWSPGGKSLPVECINTMLADAQAASTLAASATVNHVRQLARRCFRSAYTVAAN